MSRRLNIYRLLLYINWLFLEYRKENKKVIITFQDQGKLLFKKKISQCVLITNFSESNLWLIKSLTYKIFSFQIIFSYYIPFNIHKLKHGSPFRRCGLTLTNHVSKFVNQIECRKWPWNWPWPSICSYYAIE